MLGVRRLKFHNGHTLATYCRKEVRNDVCINNIANIISNRTCLYERYDWYNKNHFDYRGLIEEGLAIDANNLNVY